MDSHTNRRACVSASNKDNCTLDSRSVLSLRVCVCRLSAYNVGFRRWLFVRANALPRRVLLYNYRHTHTHQCATTRRRSGKTALTFEHRTSEHMSIHTRTHTRAHSPSPICAFWQRRGGRFVCVCVWEAGETVGSFRRMTHPVNDAPASLVLFTKGRGRGGGTGVVPAFGSALPHLLK